MSSIGVVTIATTMPGGGGGGWNPRASLCLIGCAGAAGGIGEPAVTVGVYNGGMGR